MEEHVVLKGMGELVHQHVAELRVGSREGNHHAVFQRLGEAADPLAYNLQNDVVVLEVDMGRIDDDGNLHRELVIERVGQVDVPLLRHLGGDPRQRLHPRGIVDIEMDGPHHAPLQDVPVHLVLPEGMGRPRQKHKCHKRDGDGPQNNTGGECYVVIQFHREGMACLSTAGQT